MKKSDIKIKSVKRNGLEILQKKLVKTEKINLQLNKKKFGENSLLKNSGENFT